MTMNQHEGTYSAATRVTYRCKIAWLYFRLDNWSNLTGSRIFLIYFLIIISFTVLGHFILAVPGCLWLVDSTGIEQVSVYTQIHMTRTP